MKSMLHSESLSSEIFEFSNSVPSCSKLKTFDAIVVPSLVFLSNHDWSPSLIIIVSGTHKSIGECFSAGCSDFMIEPWSVSELLARVGACSKKIVKIGTALLEGHTLTGHLASVQLNSDLVYMLAVINNNIGKLIPREALCPGDNVVNTSGRAVDMKISRLRSALRLVGEVNMANKLRCNNGAYGFI